MYINTIYTFFPPQNNCATFGVLFREMLCPSLLKKEIGDLVLAINAAFSSAFRSRLSANTNMIMEIQKILYTLGSKESHSF